MVQDIRRDIWANHKAIQKIGDYSPSFNVPRSGSLKFTKRNNPVFTIAFNGRIALPVKQDGAWRRFQEHIKQGWRFTHFRLSSNSILVSIKKKFPVVLGKNVIGVDMGTQTLASITVFDPAGDKVLKQLYLGQNVQELKRNMGIRRSKLQSKVVEGSSRARCALRGLKGREHNFDKTMCYQIAHRIAYLALQYNASIAIENLRGIKDSRLGRKINRKVKRTPYRIFKEAIRQVAWQNGVFVKLVSSRYTSQTCPICGHISRNNRTEQATFRCTKCGRTVNADRNASLNIALRAAEALAPTNAFLGKYSQGRVAVNQPLRRHEEVVEPPRGSNQLLSESPLLKLGGSLLTLQ